jgi:hypothetical protein
VIFTLRSGMLCPWMPGVRARLDIAARRLAFPLS